MTYRYNILEFRTFASNHCHSGSYMGILDHFEALNKLSAATFKRHCAEQLALFLDMRKHDMIVKLAKGEFSFVVEPDEYMTVQELARRNELDYSEAIDHLRHMEKAGIVELFTQEKIEKSFLGRIHDNNQTISSFAVFPQRNRKAFSQLPTEEAANMIHNLLLNKQILIIDYKSPGVSVVEYD